MDHEIQLISDGDGLAVIGDAGDVERFLASEGLASQDLGLRRLKTIVGGGAVIAQAGSQIAENSGRWVKLTKDSAQQVQEYGLRSSGRSGLSTGVLKGSNGQVKGFVEFAKGPGSAQALLANPAVLAGAAGIMAQVAMQQSMAEITDYLVRIDGKIDDVLRAQKDAVLSRMIGVGFVIDEAMTIRGRRGRVDEVTWSKVQTSPSTIAETQAYALRQLDAIAEKIEGQSGIDALAATAKDAQSTVQEWLAVLARCFQLQDAIAVLELDRVLDASPEELDGHRLGLREARRKRLERIAQTTQGLLARMGTAVGRANENVLLNPFSSPAIVQASQRVTFGVNQFHERLGIDAAHESSEAKAWRTAATETRDRVLDAGARGLGAARSLGGESLARVGKFSSGVAGRARRWRGGEDSDQ